VKSSVPVTTSRVAGFTSTATVLRAAAVGTINDLKLWLVRVAVGHLLALLLVVVGAGYVLQADDSPVVPKAASRTIEYAPAPFETARDREYFVSHRAVVPFGRATLEVPILMYHYIRVPPSPRTDIVGYNLSVSPQVFNAQMDWLAAHGYHPITFNDIRRYWERVAPLPSKPVIITLDDGYLDLYTTAFPILLSHAFTAVAYIVSGFVGEKGYVTAGEVLQLDRYGIEIAAHTVNHADLASSPAPWLTYQLVASRRWLEQLVGHPVIDMAYPSGKYNQQVVLGVGRAGYYSATTEQYGIFHSQADRYVWTRVRVAGGEPLNLFISNLGTSMPTVTITSITAQPPDRVAMLLPN